MLDTSLVGPKQDLFVAVDFGNLPSFAFKQRYKPTKDSKRERERREERGNEIPNGLLTVVALSDSLFERLRVSFFSF